MQKPLIITAEGHDVLVDRFGYRTRQVLEVGSQALPERTMQRLAAARALAMARQRPEQLAGETQLVLASGRSVTAVMPHSERGSRLAFIGSAILLAMGLLVLDQWHQARMLEETVDIDQAILTDEVPFTAHLDPLYPEMLRRVQ